MKYLETAIKGVFLIESGIYRDERGYFSEVFRRDDFAANVCDTVFVQQNESHSRYGVVRGLHYQLPPMAQAKLVRVTQGAILDVAVDLRQGSPAFGRHVAVELSASNRLQMFIPRGFAHGFLCLSEQANVVYLCDNYYSYGHEAAILWNDPQIGIEWGVDAADAVVSEKDRNSPVLSEARLFDFAEGLY